MDPLELRNARPADREGMLDLLELAFGERLPFHTYLEADPELDDADGWLALADGRPVSCVQIFTKRIRLRGSVVPLGGIGSVATHPDWRERGLASRLLHEAIADMERRGMVLSLLFAARIPFYTRLGWVQIPQPRIAVHRPRETPRRADGLVLRPFRSADLPAVQELYARYASGLETTTVRDAAYWKGQLRYAGSPQETFHVAERRGALSAYARTTNLYGVPTALEFARAPDAASDLAALLLELAPASRALVVPRTGDDALWQALRRAEAGLDPITDPSAMWRVLDGQALARLAEADPAIKDADLLERLIGASIYWPADRF